MPREHKRKAWVKINTSLLYEPWEPEVKLTLVMLACHLNDRWAREGLTPEEACHCVVDPQTLGLLTGRKRLDYSRLALSKLAANVSLTIRYNGPYTEINWPKFAETQSLGGLYTPHEAATLSHNEDEDEDEDEDENTTLEREREQNPPTSANPPTSQPPPASLAHSHVDALVSGEGPNPQPPDWVHVPSVVRCMAQLPGTEAEKTSWVEGELGLLGLEVLKDPKLKTKANKAAALGALAYRYYRAYKAGAGPKLKPSTPGEGVRERELREVDEFIAAHTTTGGTP